MIRGAVQRTVYARYEANVLGTDLDYAGLQYRKVVITVVVTNPPIGCKKGEIRETWLAFVITTYLAVMNVTSTILETARYWGKRR
jgi:hypothetical protein